AIDFKIELNTQTNQTLEQIAQAIFKSWFVDFDPVKAKMNGEQPNGMDTATASLFPEKIVESELGLIPEGWQVGALSSVVDVVMGQSPKGSTYNDQNEGTPLVNGPVEFGVYHPVAQKWTTAPTKMSKNKDLIVCVRGSTTGRYVVSDGEYCLGRGVCSIRSNDFPSFASYLFKSELNSLLHLTTGSTFPSWSGPTLKNFKVVVPPEAIIEKFELLIGKLCEMMARNIGQNETLSTLRDTLLPKLLSGEIDLNSEVVA
ncbi:restriction endonuclease subunit S, partial [Vibrio vulnificus]|nr:restriction endonuclease subunit S [Vibrio vulnificus]